jgi:hypothetical protein
VRYRGEAAFDAFVYDVDGGRYELVRVRDGKPEVVRTARAEPLSASRKLAASLVSDVIVCEADGRAVLSDFDASIPSGRAGLYVGKGSDVTFECLDVTFSREREPILTHLQTFTAETTMSSWAAEESDWLAVTTDLWGESRAVNWHRAAFPGGGEIRANGFFPSGEAATLRLFACCDLAERSRAASGYELVAVSPASGAERGSVQLLRDGKQVAARETLAPRGTCRFGLRRVADYVVAEMNGKTVLAYRDESPLRGASSGYAAERAAVKPEDVDVFCERTECYSFAQAAADRKSVV